jgi:hypothetical protein
MQQCYSVRVLLAAPTRRRLEKDREYMAGVASAPDAPSERPPVEKTTLMLVIEQEFDDDIRDVILSTLEQSRTDAMAVVNLGNRIKQPLNETLLSHWIRRLNILDEAREARRNRT